MDCDEPSCAFLRKVSERVATRELPAAAPFRALSTRRQRQQGCHCGRRQDAIARPKLRAATNARLMRMSFGGRMGMAYGPPSEEPPETTASRSNDACAAERRTGDDHMRSNADTALERRVGGTGGRSWVRAHGRARHSRARHIS